VKKIKIGEYLAKLQARAWLSHACTPGQQPNTLLKDEELHETITILLATLPNNYRFKNNHWQTQQ